MTRRRAGFWVRLDAVRDLDRHGPRPAVLPRNPNAHVRILLGRAAEPRGDKPAARQLDDGRGMARGKRRGLIDELGLEQRGGRRWDIQPFPRRQFMTCIAELSPHDGFG